MRYGPRRSVFNPMAATGLRAWLREDRTLVSGKLSQWTDRSGLGNHWTQATAGERPTDVASDATLNSVPTVRFGLTDNVHMSGPLKSAVFAASAWTIYALVKVTSITVNNSTISRSNSILTDFINFNDATFGIWPYGSANLNAGYNADAPTYLSGGLPITLSAWKRVVFGGNGTNTFARVAGGVLSTTAGGAMNNMTRALKIGGVPTGYGTEPNFTGYLGEMIFCNTWHSAAEQDAVFAYMGARCGL